PGGARNALLTLEWDPAETELGLDELQQAGHYLGMYARMEARREAADATHARFDEMLTLVRALPSETRHDAFPDALART
ncbi:MAG: hypothetical protein GWN71_28170, partial [Gammaproteobacteria bacterium]|nr:hypothetical protein [Gemmatimonadota bacterium]NIU77287.1 hypothetical protein [Gammaproteobacteria bacterium]